MKKRLTLKQIATEFNVSIATVSKALSDSYDISESRKKEIQEYARQHNYKRNSIALSLLQKKTKSIGVVIPTILNHFFVKVFSGIEQVADEKGYNIMTVITHGNLEKEIQSLNMLRNGMVDGLLISITEETQSKQEFKHLDDFISEGGPVVMFDRVVESISCDKIIVDDFNCAYKSTEYLIKTGCKNIAIITVLDNLGIVKLRINGYKKALEDYGLPINDKLISLIKKEYDFETEIKTMLDYQKVDAIIGLEEFSTIESMTIAESRGYKIPEDISIIGYTNGNLFKYVKPTITCINQHATYIGKIATERLIGRIEEEEDVVSEFDTKVIKTNLVLRQSTRMID